MKRIVVFVLLLIALTGCRSRDNAAGFDQAVQDIKQGVRPSDQRRSQEFQRGYREVIEKMDSGLKEREQHQVDQRRAQELHQQLKRNK